MFKYVVQNRQSVILRTDDIERARQVLSRSSSNQILYTQAGRNDYVKTHHSHVGEREKSKRRS